MYYAIKIHDHLVKLPNFLSLKIQEKNSVIANLQTILKFCKKDWISWK